jgi:hypothetical protein
VPIVEFVGSYRVLKDFYRTIQMLSDIRGVKSHNLGKVCQTMLADSIAAFCSCFISKEDTLLEDTSSFSLILSGALRISFL